jgi:hypothetical protein
MAEKCFPLQATLYDAKDAQMWFATRTSGVYAGTHLPVTAAGTMELTLGAGIAWMHYDMFAGCVYGNTDNRTLVVNMSDAALDRIDRVCIRLEMLNNKCYAYIKEGVPSSKPKPPELQRDNVAYELSIAQIRVGVGVVGINAGDITDERLDAEVCGLMSDGVTGIDTSMIQAQFASLISKMQKELQAAYDGIEKVNLIELSATLLADGWSESEPYSQTVEADGVLGADRPWVDCDLTAAITPEEMASINDAWGSVLKAESGAGIVTVYFSNVPERDIPIIIQVVR